MLKRAGLTLQDFDLYEIHEAFAAQVLCTLKAWEDPDYCRDVLGREAPMGSIDREQAQPEGLEPRLWPPVRRDRRAHPRPDRQAARRPREAAGADFGLHGRRAGRRGHRRARRLTLIAGPAAVTEVARCAGTFGPSVAVEH